MSHIKDRLIQLKNEVESTGDGAYLSKNNISKIVELLLADLEQDEKENGWIPVSERLPEFKKIDVLGSPEIFRTDKVFVQTRRGEMFVAWCHKTVYSSKIFNDEYLWYTHGTGGRKMKCMSKVIAWMPLPKPYKED